MATNTIEKLRTFPVLTDTVSTASSYYNWVKANSPAIVGSSLNMTESTMWKVAETAGNNAVYQKTIAPKIFNIDQAVAEKLTVIEQKYPSIKRSTEDILADAKIFYDTYLKATVDIAAGPFLHTVDSVKNAYTGTTNSVQNAYKNGSECIASVNAKTMDTLDSYLEYYLPCEGASETIQENPDNRALLLIAKTRQRSFKRAHRLLLELHKKGVLTMERTQEHLWMFAQIKKHAEDLRADLMAKLGHTSPTETDAVSCDSNETSNASSEGLLERFNALEKDIIDRAHYYASLAGNAIHVTTVLFQEKLHATRKLQMNDSFSQVNSILSSLRLKGSELNSSSIEKLGVIMIHVKAVFEANVSELSQHLPSYFQKTTSVESIDAQSQELKHLTESAQNCEIVDKQADSVDASVSCDITPEKFLVVHESSSASANVVKGVDDSFITSTESPADSSNDVSTDEQEA